MPEPKAIRRRGTTEGRSRISGHGDGAKSSALSSSARHSTRRHSTAARITGAPTSELDDDAKLKDLARRKPEVGGGVSLAPAALSPSARETSWRRRSPRGDQCPLM
jgi:hypothetical protein